MDVTFTNVLEGARQYFQGLPTATCTSANSTYSTGGEHQSNHYGVEQQNQERTSSASSYWPPHQESQLRPPNRERVSVDSHQRPPSHQSETPRPSSHNQTINSNNYHPQTIHQEQSSVSTSHSYQFTRPHSRELQQQHVPQQHISQQQQSQYQSHIIPNPSYHQPAVSQSQSRTPTRLQDQSPPSSMSSQSYHQLQTQSHNQQHPSQHYAANFHQQSRSYYPVHTQTQQQPQSYHHSYQTASSQSYTPSQESSYTHQSYVPHSQNSFQNDNTYATSKATTPHSQETTTLKENPASQNQQQTSQSYRTTHNLPPIAALSSLNYHSSRSREAIRISVNKTRPVTSAVPSSSASYPTKPISNTTVASQHVSSRIPPTQYAVHNNQSEYTNGMQQQQQHQHQQQQQQQQQQTRPAASQSYSYNTTVTTQSHSQFTTTASVQHRSSTHSNFQMHSTYNNTHPDIAKTYHPQSTKVIQQPQLLSVNQNSSVNNSQNNGMTPVMKQKRESPLDLSVKTVRTSADSTLDDADTHSSDAQRLAKYYQTGRPPTHSSPLQAPTSYPTYDVYANSFQRNLTSKSAQISNAGAPKVDFLPNFNVPSLNQTPSNKIENRRMPVQSTYESSNQRQAYDRKSIYQPPQVSNVPRYPVQHVNSNSMPQQSIKKPVQGLPRIDFPPLTHKTPSAYGIPSNENNRKRTPDQSLPVIPNKVPKVDVWRQTIDQQIEQRLSSYAKSRLQQEQLQKPNVPTNKPLVNGNYTSQTQDRAKDLYSSSTYHRPQYSTLQSSQSYGNNNHYSNVQTSHSQTYVPTATAHQYPGYTNHGSQQQALYPPQHSLSRTNSNPSLSAASTNRNNVGSAADRRVLSLLRNSLEIKGAKEAQRKLEQEQYKPQEVHHPRPEVQQPSTDVMAPLQPKPGPVGRHNMSPFAATSLFDRNSNTPPTYKFHLPKAIDSIKFDAEIAKDNRICDKTITKNNESNNHNTTITNNPNTDLDGLAAFLAARIRTKAELKQVGPTQICNNTNNSNLIRSSSESQLNRGLSKQNVTENVQSQPSNGSSPPKLTKERMAYPPRRRLFSRNEEDTNGAPVSNVPPRDKSGLRSSSETSVFDFPDSDSETEMPVLERQSLVDMRRDRKTYPKPCVNEETESLGPPLSPVDVSFDDACDKFMEQLKTGVGKKRGRRKKVVEPDVLAKLETVVTKEKPEVEVEIKTEIESDTNEVKEEPEIKEEIDDNNDNNDNNKQSKTESDSDSDVPLIKCKRSSANVIVSDEENVEEVTVVINEKTVTKSELSCDSSSDSETETIKTLSEKLKSKQSKSSNNSGNTKYATVQTKSAKEKTVFGDGSDFHPGWEEEVYKYKRSLRMPASLIHVTRPPQWHRLSTSLPDLDPCPNSPSILENLDCSKTKIKTEPVDSDVDSNSNFSFFFNKTNYDSEEGSSSVKSLSLSNIKRKNNNSILSRLIERCGARKRKKLRKKNEQSGPKIVPKSENQLELLPTPSLQVEATVNKDLKRHEPIIKEESVFLGFRKKTIDNFKDTFISSSKNLIGVNEQFKTVVLKSRTRTETRVLKQKATIKEVFGEDRPASAPPVTCLDNTQPQYEDLETKLSLSMTFSKDDNTITKTDVLKTTSVFENTKEVLKNKLLNRGKTHETLFKSIATKKIISDYNDDIVIKRDPESKSGTPSIDGDDYNTPARKRMKSIRRKFSSGFDYIRKKKKQVKKEIVEAEVTSKPKRRGFVPKTSPESVQDIQKEIKTWVMNKGIGETHLHRAARLGYTDITAYCLEKMDGSPSPKDNAGYTPLHEACARGHLNIAKLLLLYGANVSESAQGGIRPLHEAAENGFVEIVRLLLSYGADPILATYSGLTPLSLATDEATVTLLQNHIADIQGKPSIVWNFMGPASCFDVVENGYNPLEDAPNPDPLLEDEDVEFELSDFPLPNLYTIRGESQSERWILLQDLSNILKIKSRDALLRQISPVTPSTSTTNNHKNVLRELKMADFLEQARCCQYMCTGEKINTRASKIALVKYSEKVKQLLGVEKIMITAR